MKHIKKSIAEKKAQWRQRSNREFYMLECTWPCPYDFLLLVSGTFSFEVGCISVEEACKHCAASFFNMSLILFFYLICRSFKQTITLIQNYEWTEISYFKVLCSAFSYQLFRLIIEFCFENKQVKYRNLLKPQNLLCEDWRGVVHIWRWYHLRQCLNNLYLHNFYPCFWVPLCGLLVNFP